MKGNFIVLICVLAAVAGYSQHDPRGIWKGTLETVGNLQVSFEVSGNNISNLSATLDVPAQGAQGLKCDMAHFKNDTLVIGMKMINGKYTGRLTDENNIEGLWTQNGMNVPLNLQRSETKLELNRPQTPKPPYTYNSEDIIFQSRDKAIQFGGTITTPKDSKKHPALIMITGSGPQNRDEEIFQHRPFAVVADHLTKKGYVVLRVDDRGVGTTGGSRTNATSKDYANDVVEAIEYLKTRPEVDKKKLGLYGHSEGGLIAQIVAADRKDVDFIILMAAPGVPVKQTMLEQNKALIAAGGLSEATAESYGALYQDITNDITSSSSKEQAAAKMRSSIDAWRAKTDKTTVLQTTGITDSASKEAFVNEFLKQTWNEWTKYFMSYEPGPILQQLDCKVLALNGDRDLQVISRSNLEGIQLSLEKSKSKEFEVREVAGVNHLFQECETCTVQEYATVEQTIKPEVLDIITAWLNEHVK